MSPITNNLDPVDKFHTLLEDLKSIIELSSSVDNSNLKKFLKVDDMKFNIVVDEPNYKGYKSWWKVSCDDKGKKLLYIDITQKEYLNFCYTIKFLNKQELDENDISIMDVVFLTYSYLKENTNELNDIYINKLDDIDINKVDDIYNNINKCGIYIDEISDIIHSIKFIYSIYSNLFFQNNLCMRGYRKKEKILEELKNYNITKINEYPTYISSIALPNYENALSFKYKYNDKAFLLPNSKMYINKALQQHINSYLSGPDKKDFAIDHEFVSDIKYDEILVNRININNDLAFLNFLYSILLNTFKKNNDIFDDNKLFALDAKELYKAMGNNSNVSDENYKMIDQKFLLYEDVVGIIMKDEYSHCVLPLREYQGFFSLGAVYLFRSPYIEELIRVINSKAQENDDNTSHVELIDSHVLKERNDRGKELVFNAIKLIIQAHSDNLPTIKFEELINETLDMAAGYYTSKGNNINRVLTNGFVGFWDILKNHTKLEKEYINLDLPEMDKNHPNANAAYVPSKKYLEDNLFNNVLKKK